MIFSSLINGPSPNFQPLKIFYPQPQIQPWDSTLLCNLISSFIHRRLTPLIFEPQTSHMLPLSPLKLTNAAWISALNLHIQSLNLSQLHYLKLSKSPLEFQPWFSLKIQQIITWISVMIFMKISATIHLNFHNI